MAIYTRMGAPVQIVEAEIRRRWWIRYAYHSKVFDQPPTAKQRKGAKEESEFDIWWLKAKQTGPYPDGSGAEDVGNLLDAPEDATKRGFLDETFFRADDGIREIHDTCSNVAAYGAEGGWDESNRIVQKLADEARGGQ